MLARALLPAALLLTVVLLAGEARADSPMEPTPGLAVSQDGRWYLIVQPTDGWEGVRFQLVKRAAGAAERAPVPFRAEDAGEVELLKPDKADVVVAEGPCHMPMEIRCLDRGRGFVLFEQHFGVGYGTAIQLRDGKGKVVWTVGLEDLFPKKADRDAFLHTVSNIWWYEAFWLDEARSEIGVVTSPDEYLALLRVDLENGKPGPLDPKVLLRHLHREVNEERAPFLAAAWRLKVPGLTAAARTVYADPATPALARAHLAMYLHRKGDARGVQFVVASAKPDRPITLRRYAVSQLFALLGVKALPLLRTNLAAEDRELRRRAGAGLTALGEAALDALIGILEDKQASALSRRGAVSALWNMGAVAVRALPALDRLAKSGTSRLSLSARNAAKSIREAAAKQTPPK